MKDLTSQYLDLATEARKHARQSTSTAIGSQRDRTKTRSREAMQFASKAAEISAGINKASLRLQRLAMLTKGKSSFRDPTAEINTIATQVNEDVSMLKVELSNLENFLSSNKSTIGAGSSSATHHSETVIHAMQFQLQKAAKDFQGVLKTRQDVMLQQEKRRGRFGAAKSHVITKPKTFREQPTFPPDAHAGAQQDESVSSEQTALLESTQLVPDQSYFEARANTMDFIQSQISQIDQMMGNLATMVAQQQDTVITIDDNVTDAVANVSNARNELLSYMDSISGNRMLMIKIFFVLLFFITFFILFMA